MLAQASTLTIDQIPGGRAAVTVILQKVADFQRVPSRLAASRALLNKLITTKGQSYPATLATQALDGLSADYAATAGRVADVLTQLHVAGYADATLDLIVTATQTGASVLGILSRTKQVEDQVTALAANAGIAPSPLTTLSASPLLKYGLIAAVGYGLYTVATGKGARRSRW